MNLKGAPRWRIIEHGVYESDFGPLAARLEISFETSGPTKAVGCVCWLKPASIVYELAEIKVSLDGFDGLDVFEDLPKAACLRAEPLIKKEIRSWTSRKA